MHNSLSSWQLVESNRRCVAALGKMRAVQKRNIIEGPIAEFSNHRVKNLPVPRKAFKPVIDDDGEYVQQVAFLGMHSRI